MYLYNDSISMNSNLNYFSEFNHEFYLITCQFKPNIILCNKLIYISMQILQKLNARVKERDDTEIYNNLVFVVALPTCTLQ